MGHIESLGGFPALVARLGLTDAHGLWDAARLRDRDQAHPEAAARWEALYARRWYLATTDREEA